MIEDWLFCFKMKKCEKSLKLADEGVSWEFLRGVPDKIAQSY